MKNNRIDEEDVYALKELNEYIEGKDKDKDKIDKLSEHITKWKDIKVNIAVTGTSGSGKSTVINTLRNLKPVDPGAAKVGVKETTIKPTPYPHPRNENLIFWDLPGVGTKRFPKEQYKDFVDFQKYDFFFILSCTRFSENDGWLADEIRRAGKKFYFVRTKVDNDVDNAKQDVGASESETLSEIRQDCKLSLGNTNACNVYLISGRYPERFDDFDSLAISLINEAPSLQKEVLTMTLFSWTNPQLLREKRELLQKKTYQTALMAAMAVAVPVIGKPSSNSVLTSAANSYKREFGLDDQSIRKIAERIGVPFTEFRNTFPLKTPGRPFSQADLVSLIATIPVRNLTFLANLANAAITAAAEYFRFQEFLQKTLDEAFNDAMVIHNAFMQRASKL